MIGTQVIELRLATFQERPDEVSDWVRLVFDSLVAPLLERHPTARSDVLWGDNFRFTSRKLTPRYLDSAINGLAAGSTARVEISAWLAPGLEHKLEVTVSPPLAPGFPQELTVVAQPAAATQLANFQPELIQALTEGARTIRAATGMLNRDVWESPYEQVMGLVAQPELLTRLDHVVRGYYWGTILTAGHLDRLGGRAAVLSGAPCVRREDLSTAEHEAVYLQLSDDLTDIDTSAVRDLRSYLKPLLPGGIAFIPGEPTWPVRVYESGRVEDPEGVYPLSAAPPNSDRVDRREIDVEMWPILTRDIHVILHFDGLPTREEGDELTSVFAAFLEVGVNGGFDTVVRTLNPPTRLSGNELTWAVGFATPPSDATLASLSRILSGPAVASTSVRQVVVRDAM